MYAHDLAGFQASYQRAFESGRDSGSSELTAAIGVLGPVLSEGAGIYGKLAILAGALVEWGGSPMPLREVLPARVVVAMRCTAQFPAAWKDASGGRPLPDALAGEGKREAIGLMVAHGERKGWSQRDALMLVMSWFDVRDWIKPAITVLADREFRQALTGQERASVRDAAAAIAGWLEGAKWLQGLAMVLDDEPLIVLDPASGRGFRLTMSGVGDNFQLHTLLADRLAGNIPGLDPPHRVWVEQATDAPLVMQPPTDPIKRRFRLLDGEGAYVPPEGRPAGIGMTDGVRVLVLHPSHGDYGWSNGRAYPRMSPRLTLDTVLSDAETAEWIRRIAPAIENGPIG